MRGMFAQLQLGWFVGCAFVGMKRVASMTRLAIILVAADGRVFLSVFAVVISDSNYLLVKNGAMKLEESTIDVTLLK